MRLLSGAHAQILLAPWRQRRNEHSLPGVLLILVLLLCAAPTVVVSALGPVQLALWIGTGTVALLLQALWLAQFASLQRQNHPTAARLVPCHLQRLREAMLGLWLAIALTSALLLGSVFGHGPAWGLASAALMVLTAVMMRHPLLWSVFWIIPTTERWWGRSEPWRWLRSEGVAMYAQQPLALSLAAGLLLAPLLAALLKAGGGRHAADYVAQERMRLALRLASRGRSSLRYQGRIGTALAWLLGAPYRAWMRHLLVTARPTARSAMARLELAFGAGAHWTAQALAAVLLLAIALISLAALHLLGGVDLADLPNTAKAGLTIGLSSIAINPVMALRHQIHTRRREQALLMLLPGMPRGAELNWQLARRLLLQALASWMVAIGIAAVLVQGQLDDAVFGYALAGLPACLLLLRNWAALRPPGVRSGAAPVLLLMLGGASLYAAARWLHVSPLLMAALIVPLTAGAGLWLWRCVGRYPQALPAGRLS